MKRCRIHLILTVLFSAAFSFPLFSQDPPITWGDIPRAELEMTSFPGDTNASAVILCDYGDSKFNDEMNIVFNRHLRVKILTPRGYDWGDHSVVLYTHEGTERIYDIEGTSYSLNDHGEAVKTELTDKEIYEEELDSKHTRYKFTLPALKPGCVIEIRYTIESESIYFMRDWVFQHSEPVRWSEYRIQYPTVIAYSAVTRGFERYAIREQQEVTQVFSGTAKRYIGKKIAPCILLRLAVKNIPALRDEPFITTMNDYVNKVDVQLAGYAYVDFGSRQVMTNWNNLAKELFEHKYFGQRIETTRRIKKLAEEITRDADSQEAKLQSIYNWVMRSIMWTRDGWIFADQEVDDVIESKKGNSAEISFLFLSLMKSIGIDGSPVILSTRSHGKIQDLYPILSQFNHVLVRATIESQHYFIDATDPLRSMDMVPVEALNVRGLVIKQEGPEWITFSSPRQYVRNSLGLIDLQEDGSLNGTFEDAYRAYAGMIMRHELKDKEEEKIAEDAFNLVSMGLTIDSATVDGRDSIEAPLVLKAWVSSQAYAQSNGDLMYINPHILHRRSENPFKSISREFPVDYSYRRSYTSMIKLTIPADFEIKEKLLDRAFTLGPDLATYFRKIQVDSNLVQVMTKLEINEIEIKPKFYKNLREFYAWMIAAESEQLVLERIKNAVEPQPSKPSQKSGKRNKNRK